MSRLLFVESREAARRAAAMAASEPDLTVIALSPDADQQLDSDEVDHVWPEHFHTVADRESVGDETMGRVESWVNDLDRALKAASPELAQTDLRPAYLSFWRLKILHDAAAIRIFECLRVMRSLRPDAVSYFTTPESGPAPGGLDFMAESIWSLLIPLAARHLGIPTEAIDELYWPEPADARAGRSRLRAIGLAAGAATNLVRAIPQRLSNRADRGVVLSLDRSQAGLLVANTGFEVLWWRLSSDLLYRLDRPFLPIACRRSAVDDFREKAAGVWRELESDASFQANFEQEGVGFFEVVRSRLQRLVTELCPEALSLYLTARDVVRRFNANAVLAINLADWPERAVAAGARDVGVPVLVTDHGSMGYFHFPLDRHTDLAFADYRLVYGEGVRRSAERRYRGGARPISVGSVDLDRLAGRSPATRAAARVKMRRRLGLHPSGPVVLYSPPNLTSNNRYVSRLHATDNEVWANLRFLATMAAEFPRVQFLVKVHPNRAYPVPPLAELAAERGLHNFLVNSTVPLAEVLDVADLLISDTPTTSFLQMLTTPAPVIALHNGVMEFEPDAVEPLERATTFAHDLPQLAAALRKHLAGNAPRRSDGDFLRLYGTHRGDGRSLQRMLGVVRLAVAGLDPAQVS